MKINKAYKFRVYPNKEQQEFIRRTFGCSRFIYNDCLEEKKKEYEPTKHSKTAYECIKDIPSLYKEKPYLKEVDFMSLRCAIFDLEDALKGFYKGIRNYLKFKSKYNKNSY